MKWRVVVDIAPKTIEGTNGCHKYVFGRYKTKKEAKRIVEDIISNNLGIATVEKE